MFNRYMHLERLGTTEVEGIEIGETYVFPKLDGTNGSVWFEDGKVMAGSRNRVLSLDNDNAGFYQYILSNKRFEDYFNEYPNDILYGEWLVPHSLLTYRDDAWRKFYIFDVGLLDKDGCMFYVHYNDFKNSLDVFNLDYLAPLAIIKNGSPEQYQKVLEKNVFLIQDGKGIGEGIAIKNYGWVNKFGRTTWAKLISNAFKEEHHKVMGAPIIGSDLVDVAVCDKYITQHFVDKVVAKITLEKDGWQSRYIPQLLGTVWYDFITEELWDATKQFKNPKIDFGYLNRLVIAKIKELRPDIF